MNAVSTCPQCGSASVADGMDLCPGCLLKAASQDSAVDASVAPTMLTPSASGQFQPPTAEELNALLPALEIQELIGRGGMGAVYKARQPDLDRLVAIKILPREVNGDPGFGERFLREAQTLARLSHPNIVTVYDFGKAGDIFYFIMEYVEGVTLRQMIAAGEVKPEEAIRIVPCLCDALQFAHEEGIVHRDIKPENILLDKRGRVKIADFGLAKLTKTDNPADHELTGTHQVMGTVRYMAPEQMTASKNVDHRADIYSMGVIFYELLTGELPMGWFAPPSKKVAIDVRLDEVVLKTLESEPSRRFQHASEVKSAVEQLSSTASGTQQPSQMPGETAVAAGRSVRIHKLLDVTETKNRTRHHIAMVCGAICLTATIMLLILSASKGFNLPMTVSTGSLFIVSVLLLRIGIVINWTAPCLERFSDLSVCQILFNGKPQAPACS